MSSAESDLALNGWPLLSGLWPRIIIIIIINTRLYEELKTQDTESNSIIPLTANTLPVPSHPLDDVDIVNQALHCTDTVLDRAVFDGGSGGLTPRKR